MNKTELATALARSTSLTNAQAGEAVDALFSTIPGQGLIAAELASGGDVSIGGFGKFETRERGAREARNPATGESVHVPARRAPAFKPARNLKDRVEA